MIQIVKAKKQYKCDYSKEQINVGEKYKRVNIRNLGIFHFKITVKNKDIENYIESKYEKAFGYYEKELGYDYDALAEALEPNF